ncbi:MAG: low molecular weight phosphotyrosine protein phosphatase [Kangiellaceae bacterium]|nr:low molecular weight phosphotyrosine protein phosphatase [Kangiellaceae bacterium]
MNNKKILFVCMGNICRSPTAEGIFRRLAGQHRELNCLEIDSCGTIGYHVGENADPRSVAAAKKRGYDLSLITSRKIKDEDLEYYDYILAMDSENLSNTLELKRNRDISSTKICLFLDYAFNSKTSEVPDPYYGGPSGFDDVIDLIEDASKGLIEELLKVEHS